MADWHGYPQHPDAHPERPWWRLSRHGGYVRTDGEEAAEVGSDRGGFLGILHGHELTTQALAEFDCKRPLPPPEPRCGQVWYMTDSGTSKMVGRCGTLSITWADGTKRSTAEWPRPNAVLVAGPGAPWAPAEPA